MKNRKLILGIIGFVAFLVVVYFGYNKLSAEYYEEQKSQQNGGVSIDETNDAAIDGDKNNEDENVEKILAENFTIYDKDGNTVTIDDFKGKPLVINIFASWCGPCKFEMPYFQSVYDKYKNEDVMILMVNMTDGQRETKESAEKFMKDNGYTMPIYFDMDMDLAMKYRVTGIPRTIFIDKDGYVSFDHTGVIEEEILKTEIDKIKQ
ncbi:TlpA disulfide reductase family protein [Clostridium sp.]|uniref:TlpA family protein disulfide reductase n=1 Tax=Clostridium sp. TaxID=1506 RepID=UPI003217E615